MVFERCLWEESFLAGPTMAFYRALFATFFLFFFLRPQSFRLNGRVLLCGFLFFAMNLTYVSSLTFTSAANAIFLQYTAPLWVLLGGYFLLNEKISRSSLIGILVSSLGVLFILLSRGSWDALWGCILAGLSGFCFGGVSLLLRSLRDTNERTLTFFLHFFAAIGLVPFFFSFARLWTSDRAGG